MPVIDRNYVEGKKCIKKNDPVKIIYFTQEPELAFYNGFGQYLNVTNNGDSRGILPSEIKDVDKLAVVKKRK